MKTRSRYYDFFIVSVLFIISMLIRVYNYTEQPVMVVDELIYSFYAYSILSHNWSWPLEFMEANPALFPYILATVTYFFEGGLDVFRVVSIFFGSISVCVIYFLGKSVYNRWVGILSAILLCFSSFHIFISRSVMIEGLWIFLAYTSIYFFWRSYNREGDIKYAIASGIFLGLADDAKYNAFLLYISFALFILWIKKRTLYNLGWKHLIEKKYLLLFFVSVLVFSPVLIDLYISDVNPFYYQFFGKHEIHAAGYKSGGGFNILDMFERGFNNYIDTLIDGHSIATLSLPWLPAFNLSASILLIITLLYFLYLLLKSQPSESFLMITFIVFYTFIALLGIEYQHYLLWGLPVFFIMLSYLIVSFIEHFRLHFSKKRHVFSIIGSAKILTLVLACIFILSYIVVGIMAPSVNKTNMGGYEAQVINIKNMINPGESIVTSQVPIVTYYLDKYDFNAEENNIHVFRIYKVIETSQGKEGRFNLVLIESIKPRFLIISDYSFYGLSIYEQIIIRVNYRKISTMNGVSLYERKN